MDSPGATDVQVAHADGSAALPSQLRLAVLRLSRRLRQEAVGQFNPSQISALSSIAKHGELSLGELAAIERVAPPSMTRIAARLQEVGMVSRRVDVTDRRVARLVITDAGVDLLEATRSVRDLWLAAGLAELSEEERQVVARAVPLLEQLVRND